MGSCGECFNGSLVALGCWHSYVVDFSEYRAFIEGELCFYHCLLFACSLFNISYQNRRIGRHIGSLLHWRRKYTLLALNCNDAGIFIRSNNFLLEG